MMLDTGFTNNPLAGALNENDLLSRYLPLKYFIDFLEKNALWFTRVYKWQAGDPCEGGLLPVFIKEINKTHKDEKAALYYSRGNLELSLKSNFGCCFSLFNNTEYDNMWRIYTPPPQYGVLVVIKASSLQKALYKCKSMHGFSTCFLKKIKYLSDDEAESMTLAECDHAKTSFESSEYHAAESHFFKRKSYQHENEVRAVIGHQSPIEFFWNNFLEVNDILKIPFANGGFPIYREGYVRVDVMYPAPFVKKSHCVFLDEKQALAFEQNINDRSNEFFERPLTSGRIVTTGIHVPFDINDIEEVIIHPSIKHGDMTYNLIIDGLSKYNLQEKVKHSLLYTKKW